MEKVISCIMGMLLCVSHTLTMDRKLRDSQESTIIRTLCNTITAPIAGVFQTAQRSYNSRYDLETTRKMLGLELDDDELKKTRTGYEAVHQKFGACSDEELDFFLKRFALALKYGNKLCGSEHTDSTSMQELRILMKEHGLFLPPFATAKLEERCKTITTSLAKDLLPPDATLIEELSAQRRQDILDSLLKNGYIDNAAYSKDLEVQIKKACDEATQSTKLNLNTKYLTLYFKDVSKM
jgi:hypothetical protein